MSARVRIGVFLVSLVALLALFGWGILGAPAFGDYRGPYGDVLDRAAVPERHTTDVVSAINFDYRGIDTLGEEVILFVSVSGVVLLLRKKHDPKHEPKSEDCASGRRAPDPSNAVRVLCLGLVGINVAFGLYLVTHGQLSPGGGFQGGVVLATVPLFVYLSGDVKLFHAIAPREAVDVIESSAVLAFVAIGALALLRHLPYLANVLPLGDTGSVASSGTIAAISLITGVEVAAGFVVLLSSFLSELLSHGPATRGERRDREEQA